MSEKKFDPDLSPQHPHNQEVARRKNLQFDPKKKFYVGSGGELVLDKFGQPL